MAIAHSGAQFSFSPFPSIRGRRRGASNAKRRVGYLFPFSPLFGIKVFAPAFFFPSFFFSGPPDGTYTPKNIDARDLRPGDLIPPSPSP